MIHTTHGKAITAYKTLGEIWTKGFLPSELRAMIYLRDQLNPEVQFHDMKLSELIQKYNPKRLENGTLQFDLPEDAEAFKKDIDEIQNMEIDIDADPVIIDTEKHTAAALVNKEDTMISPDQVDRLAGFMELV